MVFMGISERGTMLLRENIDGLIQKKFYLMSVQRLVTYKKIVPEKLRPKCLAGPKGLEVPKGLGCRKVPKGLGPGEL